ncbi:MAG TPA: tRNA (N(6)-L-threonylcarbamoyladenosine(37)-C(2))-methylthiotransferase MtaB [Dissulfurispiraceae bacterium]|nr:tRNA (N(6)-L-threonylcarbamoyladenosine(37)-C(2))-methylthiotransferase MtaB [Dissulfurispiraceae bacterium]
MRIAVVTVGCRTNRAESEEMESILAESGHEIVRDGDSPDVVILNTCTVTAKADAQCRQIVRKAVGSGVRVIATGCAVELNKHSLSEAFPQVEFFGNMSKDSIVKILKPHTSCSASIFLPQRHRPILKVQEGCDNTCSYCIIPKVRGASRSVPLETILDQAKKIEEGGFREVVLSGIHLGQFGKDHNPPLTLADLVDMLLDNVQHCRLRLSSLEVNEVDDRILARMADRQLCCHLHIPLQSGDDNILIKMNRAYSTQAYGACIEKISALVPGVSIGADVIVGFPGEDESSFCKTYEFIESLPLAYLHVFAFSPRKGTPAAKMSNRVPLNIVKERSRRLRLMGNRMKSAFIQSQIGRTLDAVVESRNEKCYVATTGNFIRLAFDAPDDIRHGSLVSVRLVEAGGSIPRADLVTMM